MPGRDQLAKPDTVASSAKTHYHRLVFASECWVLPDRISESGGVEELPASVYGFDLPEVYVYVEGGSRCDIYGTCLVAGNAAWWCWIAGKGGAA
jgi:hypothetical protein